MSVPTPTPTPTADPAAVTPSPSVSPTLKPPLKSTMKPTLKVAPKPTRLGEIFCSKVDTYTAEQFGGADNLRAFKETCASRPATDWSRARCNSVETTQAQYLAHCSGYENPQRVSPSHGPDGKWLAAKCARLKHTLGEGTTNEINEYYAHCPNG